MLLQAFFVAIKFHQKEMIYPKIALAQSIIEICHAKGIQHIVIAPGSRNAPLTIGFTANPYFTCYSIADERCAAFFAMGIAQQIGKPVVVVCTSGSAVLNFYPAVAEAFYSMIPLVIISPSDADLIIDGSETRRKFIDSVIATLDNSYLHLLIQYQKTLAQRNALLKYFALNQTFDADNLSIYNEQLSNSGQLIFEKRKQFLTDFIPIFEKHHTNISGGNEKVALKYESQLFEKDLMSLLEESLQKDRIIQYTSSGIHKDDLIFEIDGFPIKKFGSQGQQKSFLIALKLAQFEFMKKQSGELPILLFDDIFDKLDETRVQKIVTMVNDAVFGQIFISDTHAERTELIIKETHQSYKIFPI